MPSPKNTQKLPQEGKFKLYRNYEEEFLAWVHRRGLPKPQHNYVFSEEAGWQLDWAWPDLQIAVELHGGVWSGGRHVRPRGFIEDRKKMNAAVALGWSVFEIACPDQFDDHIELQRVEKKILSAMEATSDFAPLT